MKVSHVTATPAKLRSGQWGARIKAKVNEGDRITVVTKAGKTWTATVEKVVWRGDGVTLVATARRPSRPSRSNPYPVARSRMEEMEADMGWRN